MKSILFLGLLAVAVAFPQGYNYPKQSSVVSTNSLSDSTGEDGYYRDVPSGPAFNNDGQTPVEAPQEVAAPVSLPVQIIKHVYVHVAPDEPEEIQPKVKMTPVAPQKHYKIIFVKAPNPPTYVAPVIPQQPLDEEKTLVYVLVRRPDEADEIVVPTPPPTLQNKPEVFFIKYKTNKEEKPEEVVTTTEAPKVEEPATESYKPSNPVRGPSKYGPPNRKYLPQRKRF